MFRAIEAQLEQLAATPCQVRIVEAEGGYTVFAMRDAKDPDSQFAWFPLLHHPATYDPRALAADIDHQASHGELEI